MAIGAEIKLCKDIKFMECDFSSLEIGINITDSDDIHISDAKFSNVNTGVKARRVRGLNVSNCTDDVSYASKAFRLSAVAQQVRHYIEHLRGRR